MGTPGRAVAGQAVLRAARQQGKRDQTGICDIPGLVSDAHYSKRAVYVLDVVCATPRGAGLWFGYAGAPPRGQRSGQGTLATMVSLDLLRETSWSSHSSRSIGSSADPPPGASLVRRAVTLRRDEYLRLQQCESQACEECGSPRRCCSGSW